jgi:antimicrobial peptide system SdpA family protein
MIFLTLSFLISIFSATIPFNTIGINFKMDKRLMSLFPQGWAFFTKSPREAQIKLYKLENMKCIEVNLNSNNTNNLFGLIRSSARLNYELAAAYNQIEKTEWEDGLSNIQINWFDSIPKNERRIKNVFDNPRLIGTYVIIIQKIIPWAMYIKSRNPNQKIPCKKIRLKIY